MKLRVKVKNNKRKVLKVVLGYKSHVFKEGDFVKHNTDNTIGKIASISDYTIVLWNDGYKERIKMADLRKVVSYVDYVEDMVQPMNIQTNMDSKTNTFTKQVYNIEKQNKEQENKQIEVKDGLDDIYSSILNENDNFDDIEDGSIDDARFTKEETLNNTTPEQIQDIKNKAIDEVIHVMKNKGMITSDEVEKTQRDIISKMDDDVFEKFKNVILNKKPEQRPVEKTEAELMLEKIKNGGPIIGDFSKFSESSHVDVDDNSETRSLSGRQNKPLNPSMNDTMENIINNLSQSNLSVDEDNIVSENKELERKLNFDGFKNIQGLKKPIQIQNNQNTPRSNLIEAINNIDWTIFTK